MERSIPQMRKISGILFDENTCKTFLIEKGVFLREYPCPLCYKSMNLHLTSSRYRCSKGHVEKQVSLYINSFFSTSKIKCNEAMEIAYYWLIGAKYSSIIHATHHSSQTITAYINHLNHLVASSLTEQSTIIGGPGIVIEIDESKISRRKNNRGHRVEGAWVVGAIERTPEKKLFIIEVKD